MWQGMDSRRFPRAKYNCKVRIRRSGEGEVISSVTENIGLGGICALLEKGLDIFFPVELEISLDDGKGSLTVSGTIVWVVRRREIKKGPSFDTGVEFSDLPPEGKARLEAVIDKATGKKS